MSDLHLAEWVNKGYSCIAKNIYIISWCLVMHRVAASLSVYMVKSVNLVFWPQGEFPDGMVEKN